MKDALSKIIEFRIGTGVALILFAAGIVLTGIYAREALSAVTVPVITLANLLVGKRFSDNGKQKEE